MSIKQQSLITNIMRVLRSDTNASIRTCTRFHSGADRIRRLMQQQKQQTLNLTPAAPNNAKTNPNRTPDAPKVEQIINSTSTAPKLAINAEFDACDTQTLEQMPNSMADAPNDEKQMTNSTCAK